MIKQYLEYVGIDKEYHFKQEIVENSDEIDIIKYKHFNSHLDTNRPEWQIINVKNNGDINNNALIIRFSHALADGMRLGEFFKNWLKFKDGSIAKMEVLEKMKNNLN